jgi:hypothetical protein
VPRGATVPLQQLWTLARAWYATRLDEQWTPRSPAESERLLGDAGLTGPFWSMRPSV